MNNRGVTHDTTGNYDRQDDTIHQLLMRVFRFPVQPGERCRVVNTLDFTVVEDLGKATVYLDEIGFEIEEYEIHQQESDGTRRLSVVFSIEMEITEENLVRMGKFLEEVARKYNGTYPSHKVYLKRN
ncbi:MAG: ribonuclease E inhibitor RraB [Calditrichaeota bacterium]|nr:ribonuclease E inhibitor RraB [Calditrichota bacterium]